MLNTDQVRQLVGSDATVLGPDGSKIGKVGQIFLDDHTSEPEWVTVKTGFFGSGESFVPLAEAEMAGEELRVPYDKEKVKDAPRVDDSDGHLSEDQEAELFRHYGLDYAAESGLGSEGSDDIKDDAATGTRSGHGLGHGGDDVDSEVDSGDRRVGGDPNGPAAVGRDVSGPTTDDAMTRSEERVDIGTERVSAGKARLRKYVVTENVTQTVPVSHEEVRIEREPITDANRDQATQGGELTSEEHEVELSAEQVSVHKETVPVERVRMGKETVTEDQTVDETVRKEQIDAEGAADYDSTSADSDSR